MTYQHKAQVYQGQWDDPVSVVELVEQFTGIGAMAAEVFPTSKYQEQYDSIINETVSLPEYKVPKPTRENVRRMLIRHAKEQMFATMEFGQEQAQATADFVRMSEERAYQGAVDKWEKERIAFQQASLRQWQYYAEGLKPLLDNDLEFIEHKIGRWFGLIELPVGFEVSYQIDARSISIEIDATSIRQDVEAALADQCDVDTDVIFADCVRGVCQYMATGAAGIAIAMDSFTARAVDEHGTVWHEEEVRR